MTQEQSGCVHALGLVRCGSPRVLVGTESCAQCATMYDWRIHRDAVGEARFGELVSA